MKLHSVLHYSQNRLKAQYGPMSTKRLPLRFNPLVRFCHSLLHCFPPYAQSSAAFDPNCIISEHSMHCATALIYNTIVRPIVSSLDAPGHHKNIQIRMSKSKIGGYNFLDVAVPSLDELLLLP